MSVLEASRKMTSREQTAYDLGFHEGRNAAIVNGKWIPVTERLPEPGTGKVICITPSGQYKVLEWLETFGCWADPGGIDFTNFKRGYVTHWMPLPEPPKEG